MWTINELCTMNQVGISGQICMGIFLGLLTFLDIMYQEIPVWILVVGGTVVGGIWVVQGGLNWVLVLMGFGVGTVFLLISYLTNQAFGYADSLLILIFGICLGVWNLMELLFYAFWLSAGFAIIQMVRTSFSRKSTYPFIPFLTVAYAGVLLL
ncbi:MAG: prepilin peptidase [Hespellia sp.]|nr:prepilin peptidase [Hespellia sp.]